VGNAKAEFARVSTRDNLILRVKRGVGIAGACDAAAIPSLCRNPVDDLGGVAGRMVQVVSAQGAMDMGRGSNTVHPANLCQSTWPSVEGIEILAAITDITAGTQAKTFFCSRRLCVGAMRALKNRRGAAGRDSGGRFNGRVPTAQDLRRKAGGFTFTDAGHCATALICPRLPADDDGYVLRAEEKLYPPVCSVG